MKLLYFHQHFSTPNGSTGIRSYEMAFRSVMEGHQVLMVCGSYTGGQTGLSQPFKWGKRTGIVDGINIIEFDLSYSNNDNFIKRFFLFMIFAFRSIIIALTFRYDIIFATSTPLTAGIPGFISRWLRGKIFVFEVRDLWPELPKAMGVITNPIILSLMSILEYVTYKSAHRLIGLSPGICEGIANKGVAKDKIIQISNGCDVDLFNNVTNSFRPDGANPTDLLFIYSGTHGIANGLDSVLDAVNILNQKGIEGYKIILIGSGREKQRLIDRSRKEGLDGIILFLDPLPKKELIRLLKGSDIGLQVLDNVPAFYYGTSPNKFFDYLSIGLPILTNYPGWVADLINNHKCGFVANPEIANSFADKIDYILNNRHILNEMSINSKSLAQNYFNRNYLSIKWIHWVFYGRNYTEI